MDVYDFMEVPHPSEPLFARIEALRIYRRTHADRDHQYPFSQ
jgi:hypothetical protein